MSSSFDFIDQTNLPVTTPVFFKPEQQTQAIPQPPKQEPETKVVTGGGLFAKARGLDGKGELAITAEGDPKSAARKAGRKKKVSTETSDTTVAVGNGDIIRAEGIVETSTISSYYETAGMLRNAMDQIDTVASEMKQELDAVRNSRTLKSKYNVMTGLASNISDLLLAKVSAIKELNSCITKANDMDYKREKDRRAAEAGLGDDKMITDMYAAFVQNPMLNQPLPNAVVTPSPIAATVAGSENIVRATLGASNQSDLDKGYVNHMANMSSSQAAMIFEQNPDVKEVVVFDASTGNKWFQIMNMATGQVIPNLPVHDTMFLEDTTIDRRNNVAKNINLNETYPLVVINDNIAKEY